MRFFVVGLVIGLAASASAQLRDPNPNEQAIVNKYLQKVETKHKEKLGWFSVNYTLNRVFRDNDYNYLMEAENNRLTGAKFGFLQYGSSIGLEGAMIFKDKFAWTIGGEFYLPMGDEIQGSFTYDSPSGPTTVDNPRSRMTVYGFSTGGQYYFFNNPSGRDHLTSLAARAGGTIGFYAVSWNLFQEYGNLNLATSAPVSTNATYTDNALGFTANVGVDYPISFGNLVLSADFSYVHLNFDKVSWYNTQDQEIIASYNGSETGRVDLKFSGGRAKIQLKKFFSW